MVNTAVPFKFFLLSQVGGALFGLLVRDGALFDIANFVDVLESGIFFRNNPSRDLLVVGVLSLNACLLPCPVSPESLMTLRGEDLLTESLPEKNLLASNEYELGLSSIGVIPIFFNVSGASSRNCFAATVTDYQVNIQQLNENQKPTKWIRKSLNSSYIFLG